MASLHKPKSGKHTTGCSQHIITQHPTVVCYFSVILNELQSIMNKMYLLSLTLQHYYITFQSTNILKLIKNNKHHFNLQQNYLHHKSHISVYSTLSLSAFVFIGVICYIAPL